MPTLNVGDVGLHYGVAGQGPPVLMIHGTGVCGSGWGPQVEGLRKDFECLWFDNRGIGKSTGGAVALTIAQMAGDALALMDAAGWESAHVVGHSMGGLIAEQVALEAPGRVRSLGLLCTFAKGPEAARLDGKTMWLGIQSRVGSRAMRRRAFLRMLFPAAYLETQDLEGLAARVGEMVGRDLADSPPIMMKQLAAMRGFDRSAELGALSSIPTLVVSGEQDPIALPVYGRGLAERIEGARFVEIAGASHGVVLQMPERVNAMLRELFAHGESRRQ